jgi:hypothetical protein
LSSSHIANLRSLLVSVCRGLNHLGERVYFTDWCVSCNSK